VNEVNTAKDTAALFLPTGWDWDLYGYANVVYLLALKLLRACFRIDLASLEISFF
jgi:hypothetical protein